VSALRANGDLWWVRVDLETKPGVFLENDGGCRIENSKPTVCKDYPYTDKLGRLWSMYSIIDSAAVCPVVFEILERLKVIYRFQNRGRR
jgi:Fe-S-cluster containining protein